MTLELTPLARMLLARVSDRGSIPRYGSQAWTDLPDQDPRRAAAVVIYAEAWRDHISPERVAADMRDQMNELNDTIAHILVGTSHEVAQALDWERIFGRATYAELADRRGEHGKAETQRQSLREMTA